MGIGPHLRSLPDVHLIAGAFVAAVVALPTDAWYVVLLHGTPYGWRHEATTADVIDGQPMRLRRVVQQTRQRFAGVVSPTNVETAIWVGETGVVRRFWRTRRSGRHVDRLAVDVKGGGVRVTRDVDGVVTTSRRPSAPSSDGVDVRGIVAGASSASAACLDDDGTSVIVTESLAGKRTWGAGPTAPPAWALEIRVNGRLEGTRLVDADGVTLSVALVPDGPAVEDRVDRLLSRLTLWR